MPGAIGYTLDKTSPNYKETEAAFTAEIKQRSDDLSRVFDYYNGNMPDPLKVEKDAFNDNVILPKIGQAADKLVSFLLGEGVQFSTDQEDTSDIDALWQANRESLLLHNLALSGTLGGHVFTRIEPRENDFPRIVNLNPQNSSVFWDVSDIGRVLWYRLQFQVSEQGPGKRVDYVNGALAGTSFDHDVSDQWWEVTWTTKGGFRPEWLQYGPPVKWPYDWSPIVEWQNLPRLFSYYGASDVSGMVRLNEALNFVASNYSRILKHHAFPKTVGLGFDADAVMETEVGGLYTVNRPRSEVDIFNLEMQSDLSSSKAFIEMLSDEIWQVARMVSPQTMKDKVGALTNFGLRVMYTDAIRKTETKRELYEEGLETITQHCLELMGRPVPDEIEIVWPDPLPVNEYETAQAGLALLGANVIDKATLRESLNLDSEKIEERLAGEAATGDNIGTRLLAAFERGF